MQSDRSAPMPGVGHTGRNLLGRPAAGSKPVLGVGLLGGDREGQKTRPLRERLLGPSAPTGPRLVSRGLGAKGRGKGPQGPSWERARCFQEDSEPAVPLATSAPAVSSAQPAGGSGRGGGGPGRGGGGAPTPIWPVAALASAAAELDPISPAEEVDEEEEDDGDDASSDGEEAKNPFPAELRGRRKKLAEAKDSMDRALEAGATFAMADLQLRSAKYAKVFKLALAAEKLFTKPNDKAKALRLYVKAVVREPERELFEDCPSLAPAVNAPPPQAHVALKQVEKSLDAWQKAGHMKAAALMGLALADVQTLLGRLQEAFQAAQKALERFESLHDQDGSARALHTTARIRLRLGTDMHTRKALEELEKALVLLQRRGDGKREAATLLMLSRAHLQRQEHQDAYAFAGGAAKLAQSNGHVQEEAMALKELAHVLLLSRGDPDRAAQFAKDAADIFSHLDDWLSEISARHVLSRAYQEDGFVNYAHEALARALRLARQLRDVRQIGAALDGITRLLSKAQAPEAALECLEEEVRLAAAAPGASQRELAALERVAQLQSRLEKHDAAQSSAERAVGLARAGGRRRELARALKLVAEVSLTAKRQEEAMDATLSAKALFEELGDVQSHVALWRSVLAMHKDKGDDTEVLRAWVEMASAYKSAGQMREAAEVCLERARWLLPRKGLREALPPAKEASKLFGSANDKEGLAKVYLWLCDCEDYIRVHPEEAWFNATAARKSYLRCGDVDGEVRALRAVAKAELGKKSFERSVEASKEALELARKAGGKRSQAVALQTVGDVHAELIFRDVESGLMPADSNVQDAIGALMDASTLFSTYGDDAGQAATLVQLSRLHLLLHEVEHALEAALAASEAAQKLGEPQAQGRALLAVARAYERSGHAREMKQAAEQAKEHFDKAQDERGKAEIRRLLKGSKHLKSGDTFQREFEQLWDQFCSQGLEPPPPQLADLEEDLSPQSRLRLTSFPRSLGGELKWYIWNGIWYAANTRVADYCEGRERKEKMENAQEDFKRMDRHFLTAKLERILPAASLRDIGKQAEVAGFAATDAAVGGKSLAATGVQALPAPRGIDGAFWGRVVVAVRLAAAAVAEKLMECSSSDSSSSEEDPSHHFNVGKGSGKGGSPGNGSVKAVSRPIGFAARGVDGHGSPLVDMQEMELAAESRRARLLSRPPPASEAPDEPREQPVHPAVSQAAAAPPEEDPAPAPGALTLAEILQAVRQDWSSKEVQAVLDKLAKIQISSAEQLFSLLRAKGVKGVNNMLKAAGQKCLKSETLAALHEYGEASGGAADSLG